MNESTMEDNVIYNASNENAIYNSSNDMLLLQTPFNQTIQDPCSCSTYQCPLTLTVSFWLEGILLPIIGMFGLVGNMTAVFVLTRKEMKSNFNYLLVTLSVVDSLYVTTGIFDYSLVKVFEYHPQIYVYLFPYFWYPFKNVVMSSTTFLIMGITTERYLAVCRPIVYRNLEMTHSTLVRVLSVALPCFFLSLILNVPTFFEAGLDDAQELDDNNETITIIYYYPTDLRLNQNYEYYYINWTRLVLTGVLPFTYLTVINSCIYKTIRKNNKSSVRSRSMQAKKAGKLAFILIAIVLVFLVSNIPRLVLNLYEAVGKRNPSLKDNCQPQWFTCLISISHILLVFSSSINFLIYCSVGDKFKKILCNPMKRIKGLPIIAKEDSQINDCREHSNDKMEKSDSQSGSVVETQV